MTENQTTLLDYIQKHHPECIVGPTDVPAEKFYCCTHDLGWAPTATKLPPGKLKALRLEVDDVVKKVTFVSCIFCHTPWWLSEGSLFDCTPKQLEAARLCVALPHVPSTRVKAEIKDLVAQLPKGYLERSLVPPNLCPAQCRLKDGRILPLCYVVDSSKLFYYIDEPSQLVGIDQVESVEKSPYFVSDAAWKDWKVCEERNLAWPLYVKAPDGKLFCIDAVKDRELFFEADGFRGEDLTAGPHPAVRPRPDNPIYYKGPSQTIHFVCADFGTL